MSAPNLFLSYVTDVERSTAFYSALFDIEPRMVTPNYVAFEVAPGVLFSISGARSEQISPTTPRTSEIGLMVPPSTADVDDVFSRWQAKGVTVVEKPHDEVFGRTFVIADPDGNLVRVAPID